MDDFDSLIQGKLDADTTFNDSLAALSEDEKITAIETKRKEITKSEWASLTAQQKKDAELANNYRIRAEKAEKAVKSKKGDDDSSNSSSKESDLSMSDLYAFTTAKVHEEDVSEVMKAAKLLGKEPREALKDPIVQAILEKKNEQRKTADATNTNTARRSNRQLSGEEVLSDVRKGGEIPEKGSREAEEMFWARHGGKPSK